MNEQTMKAFSEEIASIQKQAGIGSFLTGGIKAWGAPMRQGLSRAAAKSGGHMNLMKKIYQGTGSQQQGVMAGLGRLAKSRYGKMGATAGLAGLAGYGAYKATLGRDGRRQQQQRY